MDYFIYEEQDRSLVSQQVSLVLRAMADICYFCLWTDRTHSLRK